MVTIDNRDRLGPSPIYQEQLSVGQVIGDTFRVVGRTWPYVAALTLIPVLVGIPILIMQAGLQAEVLQNPGRPMTPEMLAQYKSTLKYTIPVAIFQTVLFFWMFGAVSDGASRVLDGQSFGFGRALMTGLRRFFSVLVSYILFYIMFVVGFVLLLVPGIWVGAAFGLGPVLAVVERRGPLSSLSRSQALTYGNRWRCIGATLVMFLILIAAYAIQFGLLSLLGPRALIWLSPLASFLILPIMQVFPIAMVAQLKRLKDDGGHAQVAGVF